MPLSAPPADGRSSETLAPLDLAPLELVIFDCDGVLIDSEPLASRTMAATLAHYGIRLSERQALVEFTGFTVDETLARLATDYGLRDPQAFRADWDRALHHEFDTSLTAMAGIEAVVAAIRQPVCVASNSTLDRLHRSLRQLPLARLLEPHVFSAEMVARPKPAPDLLLHAAQTMGARPARSLMIDDSPHGIEAARAAGMLPVGFVAPDDPRPGRAEALAGAGAVAVAHGAAELPAILAAASREAVRA